MKRRGELPRRFSFAGSNGIATAGTPADNEHSSDECCVAAIDECRWMSRESVRVTRRRNQPFYFRLSQEAP